MAQPQRQPRSLAFDGNVALDASGTDRSLRREPPLIAQVLRGGLLLGGQRLVSLAVAGLGSIVLARLLTPDIFGTYAVLWFLVALAINTADLGLTSALIQRDEPSFHRSLRAVVLGQVATTCLAAAVLAAAAPLIAPAFGLAEAAEGPLRLLTLLLPLAALRLPAAVLLERRLAYMPLTLADAIDTIVFYGVAVLAAVQQAGLWSFVIGVVVGRVVSVGILWLWAPWPPAMPLRWAEWRAAVAQGWSFQGTALTVQAREAITPVLVRALAGVQAVGFLNLASTLALQTMQMTNVASRVLFPAFSQMRHDRRAVTAAFDRALNRVAVIVCPAAVILGAAAEPLIRLVYGPQWVAAIPSLQLFCVSALVGGITMVAIQALNGLGHARVVFRLNLAWTLLLGVLTWPLVERYGFVGYAMAHMAQGLTSLAAFVLLRRLVPIRLWAPVRAPGIAAGCAGGLLVVIGTSLADLSSLAAALGMAGLLYLGLLATLSGAAWRREIAREWKDVIDSRWSPSLS